MLLLVADKNCPRFAGHGMIVRRGHRLAQNQGSHAIPVAVEQEDYMSKEHCGDRKEAPDVDVFDCGPGSRQWFEVCVRDGRNDHKHKARCDTAQRQGVSKPCFEVSANFDRESDKNEEQQDINQDHGARGNRQLPLHNPTSILKHREVLDNQTNERETRDADAEIRGSARELAVRFGPDSHSRLA